MNFRRVWSAEPDYKCKFRDSKNKAQEIKTDINMSKKLTIVRKGINTGAVRKYASKKGKKD